MSTRSHWQQVYEQKRPEQVSWFRPHLGVSLSFLASAALARQARIVDVGGGASTLIDDLLTLGYTNTAVIDIAASALDAARARLGERAGRVDWIAGDVTTPLLARSSVDFWHDRAVFHFLVEDAARDAYREQLLAAVKPGGWVTISAFALDGPERCSGLPTRRYDPAGIQAALGADIELIDQAAECHTTPTGAEQPFVYAFCRRVG